MNLKQLENLLIKLHAELCLRHKKFGACIPFKLFNEKKNRVEIIGSIQGDDFVRPITESQYCRIFKDYGIQEIDFQLFITKCKRIRLVKENGDELVSDVKDWIGYDKIVRDIGSGVQRFKQEDEMVLIKKH